MPVLSVNPCQSPLIIILIRSLRKGNAIPKKIINFNVLITIANRQFQVIGECFSINTAFLIM